MCRLYETSPEEFLTEDYLQGVEIILALSLRISLLLDEEQKRGCGRKAGKWGERRRQILQPVLCPHPGSSSAAEQLSQ